MLLVRGVVKDYDWGIVDGLVAWTHVTTGAPQAELWFGVHPGGPSPVLDERGALTDTVLADHFDVEHIPVLVKVLAASRPLSIQVHPNATTARRMWDAQAAGTGRTVLTDPFEKTEMLVALTPFVAFAGWRDGSAAADILDGVPGCTAAVDALRDGDHLGAVRILATGGSSDVAALPKAARAAGLPDREVDAYATVARDYPQDPAGPFTALLAVNELAPGEALFVPAGVPHTYVSGTGLEVMTSSDNVLRFGLTSKAVFVEEGIDALDEAAQACVVRARTAPTGERRIEPPGGPFAVTLVDAGRHEARSGHYRIVLALDGEADVASGDETRELRTGRAAVLAADEPDAVVTARGLIAVVTALAAPAGAR